MLYNVRSILPRIHWSAEELAEGAFIVGEVNSTSPHHQPASNITSTVIKGVNKTIMGVIEVLGDVAKDVARDILHPSPQNVPLPPTSGGEIGEHMVMPHPGARDPVVPPFIPSEVMTILKVAFVNLEIILGYILT